MSTYIPRLLGGFKSEAQLAFHRVVVMLCLPAPGNRNMGWPRRGRSEEGCASLRGAFGFQRAMRWASTNGHAKPIRSCYVMAFGAPSCRREKRGVQATANRASSAG